MRTTHRLHIQAARRGHTPASAAVQPPVSLAPRQALFWKYDVNNDHKLDVNEAVELLKAVCADNDLTTNWITPKMIAAQFRAAVGDSTPRDSEDQEVTLTQEQFQAFCKTIVNFMSHLGGTTMSDMPVPVLRGDTAAREIEAEGDQSVGDPPARKGGCGCFG